MSDEVTLNLIVGMLSRIESRITDLTTEVKGKADKREVVVLTEQVDEVRTRTFEGIGREHLMAKFWTACSASAALGIFAMALAHII